MHQQHSINPLFDNESSMRVISLNCSKPTGTINPLKVSVSGSIIDSYGRNESQVTINQTCNN